MIDHIFELCRRFTRAIFWPVSNKNVGPTRIAASLTAVHILSLFASATSDFGTGSE